MYLRECGRPSVVACHAAWAILGLEPSMTQLFNPTSAQVAQILNDPATLREMMRIGSNPVSLLRRPRGWCAVVWGMMQPAVALVSGERGQVESRGVGRER
jgi:hypothetical protein